MSPLKLNIPLPSRGLVVDRPAEYVDSRSAANIQNMEFNRSLVRKRRGSSIIGSSLAERIQRYFELQVGATTRLFRVGPSKLQDLNKSAGTWASATATPLTGAETDPVSVAFPLLSGNKVAVYTNGVDALRKVSITGNDATLGGSPPKVRYCMEFGDYLILAYVVDDGSGNTFYSRVQWPDTGNPESWTAGSGSNAGSVDLLEDPDDITGLGVFGNFITVHKCNSIYVGQLVSTSAVFRFDRKATGVGTVSEATIANIPSGEQIFLASDGIHLFNGITAPLVESPVQDELRETINPSAVRKSQGVFVGELDEYWVAVPTGSSSEPTTVYKYNWRTKQVYKDERTDLTALGLFLNTAEDTWDDRTIPINTDTTIWNSSTNLSLNPVVIFGDGSGVSSERTANTHDDAGVAVSALWETKDFTATDLGESNIDRIVRWKGMEIWAIGSTVVVEYSTDSGATWTPISTVTLSALYPLDDSPLELYFDALSSKIRFRFSNAVSEGSFTLKKYQIEATIREARK